MENLSIFIHDWTWVVITFTMFILYLTYWYQRPKNFPPGPRGLPFVGYLPFLSKRIERGVFKLSKKYGPVMSVRMGPKDMVILNDLDSIQKALVKNGQLFSGRGRFASFDALKNGHGIVVADYNEAYKSQRRFGLMTLRGFGVGKKGMEKICIEEMLHLNEEIQKQNGKPFDIETPLQLGISNNICQLVFGNRFDYKDEKLKEMIKIAVDEFDDPYFSFTDRIITLVPNMKYVPPFSIIHNRFINEQNKMFAWLESIAHEHEETFDENNIRDFIDAFIQEKRKGKDPSFTDFQMINFIHDLFVGGTETTSSTMNWALLCLLHYPEAQKKLRKEVVNIFDTSGIISMSKRSEMHYTNAFIQELMRFRTMGPLSLPHKTNADVSLDGYFIPEGTLVLPNIWAVHNDSTIWKNPEVFNPERFLDEQGNFIKSSHTIPFSVGPRHCLGEQLAQMELFIFLVGLVQKFEFLPDPNAKQLPDIIEGSLGMVFAPAPYKIVAKEY